MECQKPELFFKQKIDELKKEGKIELSEELDKLLIKSSSAADFEVKIWTNIRDSIENNKFERMKNLTNFILNSKEDFKDMCGDY